MSRATSTRVSFISLSWRKAGLGLALALWFANLSADVALAALPNYFVRNLLVEDGLPEDSVTAVVQTDDGYLWMGTYSGLARFDGVRFTVFDSGNNPELASSRITCLFQDKHGELWIGHEAGELTRYDKTGHFHAEPVRVSWKGRKIFGIAADETGDLWLINDQGILGRVKDGAVASPQPGRREKLVGFADGFDGSVWVTRDGYASVLRGGVLTAQQLDGPLEDSYVQGVCPSRDGKLWVVSQNRLRKWNGAGWVDDGMPAPLNGSPLTAFIETQSGLFLLGTQDKGLFLMNPQGETLNFSRSNGLQNDWIRSLCADREGNLWVATGGGGVAVLRASCAVTVNPPDQWQGRPVLSVSPSRDGGVWIGTEGAGLYHFQNGQWSHFGTNVGLPNLFVWSVAEEPDGQLWAATWGAGLFGKKDELFSLAPGLEQITVPMTALLCTRGGGLWIGTEAGLLHYDGKNGAWFGRNPESVRTDVRAIVEDRQGTVWFGMLGGGLACLSNSVLQHFGKENGLSSDFVECLHLDTKGALWIGTFGGGVDRLKNGQFSAITVRQGLPNDIIGCIVDDGDGNYWMSSHAGIIRVDKQDLDLCADGKTNLVHCASFGKSDGLPTLECSTGFQPAGCSTPDGRLWFPTGKGLVALNPKDIHVNQLPPPVIIEEVRVDGRPFALRLTAKEPLRIAPGQHRVEIDYTALSFVAPEKVRFRYRMEGLDGAWTEAGGKRSASFEYVPPGQYVFHVMACNDAGIWNEEGADVAFVMLPHFWQTWWFGTSLATLSLGVVGAGVWLDTRRRMRRKMETLERQKAVEHERSRIARDIHDELGSHLTRITMLSEPARHEPDAPHPGTTDVRQIYDIARALTRTMDEIVWAVNPQHDTPEGLVNYLEQFALEFLGAAGIRCRLDLPMQLPAWPLTAETRHNLFLALKEALHNAVKHAGATEVRIALTLEARTLTLSVEDNGCGFDPGTPNSTGNGLENMRRRLEHIGGSCEIGRARGQGVKVVFIVPMRETPAGAASDYRAN
jgi:signal transduction histidine kinase/ligand-binding sensor domain-containing protein